MPKAEDPSPASDHKDIDDCAHQDRAPTVDLDSSPNGIANERVPKITWQNRKWMAWCCIVAMFAITAYASLWMPLERFDKVDNFLQNFLWVCFAVVSVYMGTTTIPALYMMRGKK